MIDLTNYIEIQEDIEIKTIITCSLRLDKNTMIEALKNDCIYINGDYFKIPEKDLLNCLTNNIYGEIRIELEKIS
jgi:hypothetical protein